jgi:hypothetical protein
MVPAVSKMTVSQFVAIVILIPFLVMESFLAVLVFTNNYTTVMVVNVGEEIYTETSNQAVEAHIIQVDEDTHQQQVEEKDDNDGLTSPIVSMESMLKDALSQFNGGFNNSKGKESAETLCGAVWNRAVEALSLSTNNDDDDDGNSDTMRALAMDAQCCLGGAGLAFLSREVDIDSVIKSRGVFESLSLVDSHRAEVRAGLGTALLILGVIQGDESLLKLAMFHLKAASSLCQGGDVTNARLQVVFQSDASAIEAAVLHNLALAYIALGDDISPVPLLLRSAALQREQSQTSNILFWNAPGDVLLAVESQAMLMGVKKSNTPKTRKLRFPFLSDRFAAEELAS